MAKFGPAIFHFYAKSLGEKNGSGKYVNSEDINRYTEEHLFAAPAAALESVKTFKDDLFKLVMLRARNELIAERLRRDDNENSNDCTVTIRINLKDANLKHGDKPQPQPGSQEELMPKAQSANFAGLSTVDRMKMIAKIRNNYIPEHIDQIPGMKKAEINVLNLSTILVCSGNDNILDQRLIDDMLDSSTTPKTATDGVNDMLKDSYSVVSNDVTVTVLDCPKT